MDIFRSIYRLAEVWVFGRKVPVHHLIFVHIEQWRAG